MKKPTIAYIKKETQKKAPYFFDRKTLKRFGQNMKSFKVHQTPSKKIFIYAKQYDSGGRYMGYSFHQFKNGDLVYKAFGTVAEMKKTK